MPLKPRMRAIISVLLTYLVPLSVILFNLASATAHDDAVCYHARTLPDKEQERYWYANRLFSPGIETGGNITDWPCRTTFGPTTVSVFVTIWGAIFYVFWSVIFIVVLGLILWGIKTHYKHRKAYWIERRQMEENGTFVPAHHKLWSYAYKPPGSGCGHKLFHSECDNCTVRNE